MENYLNQTAETISRGQILPFPPNFLRPKHYAKRAATQIVNVSTQHLKIRAVKDGATCIVMHVKEDQAEEPEHPCIQKVMPYDLRYIIFDS